MAASGAAKSLRTEKLDEAQASARSCAGRPDFLPCDGLSVRHGKCFKLHWCCHLGWCHCEWMSSETGGVLMIYTVASLLFWDYCMPT